jgi:hypothetical protein
MPDGRPAASAESALIELRSADVHAAEVAPLAAVLGLKLDELELELPHPATSSAATTTAVSTRKTSAAPRRLVSAWKTFTFCHLPILAAQTAPRDPWIPPPDAPGFPPA